MLGSFHVLPDSCRGLTATPSIVGRMNLDSVCCARTRSSSTTAWSHGSCSQPSHHQHTRSKQPRAGDTIRQRLVRSQAVITLDKKRNLVATLVVPDQVHQGADLEIERVQAVGVVCVELLVLVGHGGGGDADCGAR